MRRARPQSEGSGGKWQEHDVWYVVDHVQDLYWQRPRELIEQMVASCKERVKPMRAAISSLPARKRRCAQSQVANAESERSTESTRRANARLVFFTFVLTFIASRVLVFLIMSRRVPDLFLHVGGTHVHHLNYGIFLLCGVGAYLLFGQPTGKRLRVTAIAYGIGLALTFDEFGMWIHLGGSYWQRASFDAVAAIIGILGFIAYFPSSRSLRRQPWWQVVVVVAGTAVFFAMLYDSFRYAGKRLGPRMEVIEESGPK